jgi:hypothetical protein
VPAYGAVEGPSRGVSPPGSQTATAEWRRPGKVWVVSTLLSAKLVILCGSIIFVVVGAVLVSALVGIVLRNRSSGSGPGLVGSEHATPDTFRDSQPAEMSRLIVEEWRDGDLVVVGTVVDSAARPGVH